MIRRQSATGNSSIGCDAATPAALTSTSIVLESAQGLGDRRAARRRVGHVALECGRALQPGHRSRPRRRHRDRGTSPSAPSPARRDATARPMPPPAPDTNAVFPVKRSMAATVLGTATRGPAREDDAGDGDHRAARGAGSSHRSGRGGASGEGGTFQHQYAATGAVQADIGLAGAGDIDAAVDAARAAQPAWRDTSPAKRAVDPVPSRRPARTARRRGGGDRRARQRHSGQRHAARPVRRQLGALLRGLVRQARWRSVAGERRPGCRYVRPEPYGVIAAIPPWNGSMMGMGQKVAPALAAGNAVVVKPPELAPFGMLRFGELALEAGLPPGVLNIVTGGAVAGDALVRHAGCRQDQLHRQRRDRAPDHRRVRPST